VKREWNKKYYVYNDEILGLIRNWREASPNKKHIYQTKILNRMGYMVNKRIASYKETDIYEDLIQEGRMGIIMAMEKFDNSRGINFFQYSGWHIKNNIRTFLRRERKKRCEIPTENVFNYIDEDAAPADEYETREAKKVLQLAIDKLPEMDRRVVEMRFGLGGTDGQTYQEIGNTFSLTRQRIEQIHSRAISKLRKNEELKKFFDMG